MDADRKSEAKLGEQAPLEPNSQPVPGRHLAPAAPPPEPRHLRRRACRPRACRRASPPAACLSRSAVLADGTILSGHRRWRAAQAAGLEAVPATVACFASTLDEQAALIEHNRQRVKSYSQRMREADQLEAIERERAEARQRHHGGTAPGGRPTLPASLPAVRPARPATRSPPPSA